MILLSLSLSLSPPPHPLYVFVDDVFILNIPSELKSCCSLCWLFFLSVLFGGFLKFSYFIAVAVELAEMLSADMKKEGLSGRTLTLKLKTASFEVQAVPYQ